jgi:hypothetical protein
MALAACSVFGNDKDPDLEPAKLLKFKSTVVVKRLWTANLGGGYAMRPPTMTEILKTVA